MKENEGTHKEEEKKRNQEDDKQQKKNKGADQEGSRDEIKEQT